MNKAAKIHSDLEADPGVQTVWEREADLVFRRLGDEMVLVPIRKGIGDFNSFYVLNEVAAFVWELLRQPHTAELLCARVVAEFDVEPALVAEDLHRFLAELQQLGGLRARTQEETP